MKNKNLNLTPTSVQNIEFIRGHEDITNDTQAIRTAINFYANYLRKEDAKLNVYSKPPKQASVAPKQRRTKEDSDRDEGAEICVIDFEGIVVDEDGNETPTGDYCRYDSYEQVTPNKILKAPDMVNPLIRLSGLLASGEKYRNTNKKGVERFKKNGGSFTLIEGKTNV